MMNGDQAKGMLGFFLGSMEMEYQASKRVIAAVPQAKSEWRPDPKSMYARELAWHIATADTFFMDAVINLKFAAGGDHARIVPQVGEHAHDSRALGPQDQLAAHDLGAAHSSRQPRGNLVAQLLKRLCHRSIPNPSPQRAKTR